MVRRMEEATLQWHSLFFLFSFVVSFPIFPLYRWWQLTREHGLLSNTAERGHWRLGSGRRLMPIRRSIIE